MNKKLARSGPRIKITRPALKNFEDTETVFEDRKFVFSCQYCRLKFTQNSQFIRHMMSNHQVQQKAATYQCHNCQIVFTHKCNLDIHCQTHHQIKSKSRCDSCAITFKSRYCLRRHLKLKQVLQENSCLKCQKTFLNKERLTKHVKNKHTPKNIIYPCTLCSLKFKVEDSLRSHLARIHKNL